MGLNKTDEVWLIWVETNGKNQVQTKGGIRKKTIQIFQVAVWMKHRNLCYLVEVFSWNHGICSLKH